MCNKKKKIKKLQIKTDITRMIETKLIDLKTGLIDV
jgi:hypothetical protein